MMKELAEIVIDFIIAVLLITVTIIITIWVGHIRCDNQFQNFERKFKIIGGCLVKEDGGKWVPDERFRVVE